MTINSELICKYLQSLDRRERQRALNDLLEYAVSKDNTDADIIESYDRTYLYILKCYSDKYECCRGLAANVVTEFFRRLPPNDYYLQYVMTMLAGRIGQKECIEESEEMRLQLLIQLEALIDKFRCEKSKDSVDMLLKSYDEIINILIKELKDNYPSAQRQACACIRTLAEATPSFHYRAEILIKPLIGLLHHKHSMNRINAIDTLGIISLHIMTNSDCISQIITEISPLLMDSMPLVRKECGKAGCRMLMELRDRYSFFPRILPLVLCCLNDDVADVHDLICDLWLKCGRQYYEENENELGKKEIVDEAPKRYPDDIARPSLGCRALVQRSLKIIPLILKEVADWKEEVRLHSLKLLWQIILHAEVSICVHLLDIFPVLARGCADPDKLVNNIALKCSELMGMLMVYKEWFTSCVEILQENPRLGCLKCFYSLYSAAVEDTCKDDIEKVAKILHGRDFSHNMQPEFQMYLLKFVDVLSGSRLYNCPMAEAMENLSLADRGSADSTIEQYLYHVVIKVMALSYDTDVIGLQQEAQSLLVKLANGEETAVSRLHEKHLNSVLVTFDCLDAENDANSEPILLLHGVICFCGFQRSYLDALKECIKTVWEHGSSDGKVKIFSAISIAMMSWNKTIEAGDENRLELLRNFLNDIVLPYLQWKPGASAEGLRSMATATLCSMGQGAPDEAPILLSELAAYFPGLVEDNNVTTRVYALRSLANIGSIKLDDLRILGYAVVQRLDDPSGEVRDWAARVIPQIRVDKSARGDSASMSNVNSFVADVFKILFLHFEGPELKLRNSIKSSIIELGRRHVEVFNEAFNKAFAVAGAGIRAELGEIKASVDC